MSTRVATTALVAAAFATAGLHLVQTAAFSLLAIASPHLPFVVGALHLAFLLVDLAMVAALALAARAFPAGRPLSIPALVLSLFAPVSAAISLAARAKGSGHGPVRLLSAALEQTEPLFAMGTSVLLFLFLTASLRDRGAVRPNAALAVVFHVAVLLGLALRFGRVEIFPGEPLAAWAAWWVDLARVGTLAALTVALRRATPSLPAAPAASGDAIYRAPAAMPPDPERERRGGEMPPMTAELSATLRKARSGLGLHLAMLGVRSTAGVTVALASLVVINTASRELAILLFLLPLVGLGASLVMLVGLTRVRALESMREGGSLLVSTFATAAGVTGDAAAVLALLVVVTTGHSRSWRVREMSEVIRVYAPLATLVLGVALLAHAVALGRASESLGDDEARFRARLSQAFLVTAATGVVAMTFSSSERAGDAALLLSGALALFALGSMAAAVLVEALAVLAVRRELARRSEERPRAT